MPPDLLFRVWISALRKHQDDRQTFLTDSLLQALNYAGFCANQGVKEVHITCINTRTIKTAEGKAIDFDAADPSSRNWVSVMPIPTGEEGSCTVSFGTLVQKRLYDFYPALQDVRRQSSKLHVALSMLRQFGFSSRQLGSLPQVPLTKEILDAAVGLVAAFQPCSKDSTIHFTQAKLVAWFVSLQSRNPADPMLRQWLYFHTDLSSSSSSSYSEGGSTSSVPIAFELTQYHQLCSLFRDKVLRLPISHPTLSPATVCTSKDTWMAWIQNQEQRRLARANRSPKVEKQVKERKCAQLDARAGKATGFETKPNYVPMDDRQWEQVQRGYFRSRNAGLQAEKIED